MAGASALLCPSSGRSARVVRDHRQDGPFGGFALAHTQAAAIGREDVEIADWLVAPQQSPRPETIAFFSASKLEVEEPRVEEQSVCMPQAHLRQGASKQTRVGAVEEDQAIVCVEERHGLVERLQGSGEATHFEHRPNVGCPPWQWTLGRRQGRAAGFRRTSVFQFEMREPLPARAPKRPTSG
jgi:hypothetical protein